MRLRLLHTSEAHVARFDALRDRIAPGAALDHAVRPDWLTRARDAGAEALRADLSALIGSSHDRLLCTCTTLGPVAGTLGAMRVDWPMMRRAAQVGGPILLTYVLESTRDASMALLRRALNEAGREGQIHPLSLAHRWPLFEAGEAEAFAGALARDLRDAMQTRDADCVVLAQVSMADAAAHLADLGIPVLSAPELALREGLGLS